MSSESTGLEGSSSSEKILYDYLGDYGIVDGKYELYHITLKTNLQNILRWGINPPRAAAEQTFDKFDPHRGVYLVAEEIHVLTFLGQYQEAKGLEEEDLVVLRVSLSIVWPVEIDPGSLVMEGNPTGLISRLPIPAELVEVVEF